MPEPRSNLALSGIINRFRVGKRNSGNLVTGGGHFYGCVLEIILDIAGFGGRFSRFAVEKCFYFFISALFIDSFRSNRQDEIGSSFSFFFFLKFSFVENNNSKSLSI